MSNGAASKNGRLRSLPSVDDILGSEAGKTAIRELGTERSTSLVREIIEEMRSSIAASENAVDSRNVRQEAIANLEVRTREMRRTRITKVVNATGVILHTNLGRAPLSVAARNAVVEAASYCSLELSLDTGKRAGRAPAVESLICEQTGAEAALVVNNCAAAALLVLSEFAAGGEVIVSRGELVEIGGDFRVPDILERSGARLREVGTTNRTKIADYARAVSPETRLILRVHPSNYRIVGFTAAPEITELSELAREKGVLLYEDIGSGALAGLGAYGLGDEPSPAASIAAGVHVVTFSGDKLLGGPQSGIITGKSELVERLRKNPLYRALRPGKLDLAALEATLDEYRRDPLGNVPVLKMIAASIGSIESRSKSVMMRALNAAASGGLQLELVAGRSAVGGGSAPAADLPTMLIAVTHAGRSAAQMERQLRQFDPPVLARISDGRLLLDLRTVALEDEAGLADAIASLA